MATAVIISLIFSLGWWDPQPVGQASWQSHAQTVNAPTVGSQLDWVAHPPLPTDFSWRGALHYQSGHPDSGAGVALGDGCTAVVVAVAATGYLTVQQQPATATCAAFHHYIPWQTWPHVRPDAGVNEIWLDWANGRLTVRINRELLWTGLLAFQPTQFGFYSEGFGQTAVYQADAFTLYTP